MLLEKENGLNPVTWPFNVKSQNESDADYMADFALSHCSPIRDDHRSGLHSALQHANPESGISASV